MWALQDKYLYFHSRNEPWARSSARACFYPALTTNVNRKWTFLNQLRNSKMAPTSCRNPEEREARAPLDETVSSTGPEWKPFISFNYLIYYFIQWPFKKEVSICHVTPAQDLRSLPTGDLQHRQAPPPASDPALRPFALRPPMLRIRGDCPPSSFHHFTVRHCPSRGADEGVNQPEPTVSSPASYLLFILSFFSFFLHWPCWNSASQMIVFDRVSAVRTPDA